MRPGWDDEYFDNSLGYFHWPVVWVKDPPPVSDGEIDARRLGETVYQKILDSGVEVKVYRDGMFDFRLSDWSTGRYPPPGERAAPDFDAAEMRAPRVKLLNAYLACLYTVLWRRQDSTLKRMIVSPDEIVQIKLLHDNSEHITRDERFQALLDAQNPAFIKHWSPPPELDWRFGNRVMVVEVETVEESFALLDRVLQRPEEDALILTELYARAAKYNEERNHDVCLITSWAIIERLLNRLSGTPTGDRTPNARKLIKDLSGANSLSPKLCKEMSIVCDARDHWIHRLTPVTKDKSGKAIRVAEDMLGLCFETQFAVPLEPGQRWEERSV